MPSSRTRPKRPLTAKAYLAARTQYGVKFGLETTRALCEALDHPERSYPSLLVAGTNGKGSVVAYLSSALRASGLKVGRYTSPHLLRVNERIVVGGQEITDRDLSRAVALVQRAADKLHQAGLIPAHPTYFETLTVAAFEHFRLKKVDVAVLEVGMGGRLDATNVVEPVASAIVTIAKDHEAFLGKTVGKIAREKAGVLRPSRKTVLGDLPEEALRAIEVEARKRGAELVLSREGSSWEGERLKTPVRTYEGLRPLPGVHQRDNLLVAIRLLEIAAERGLGVRLDRVSPGIRKTRWRGRLEWIPGRPPLLLDGAHNPAGAEALADHLRTLRPFVLVFGVMRDKDISGLALRLFPLAESLVLTQPPVKRAATPREIASRAGRLAKGAFLEPSPRLALARARLLSRGRPVVIAGSLYLVGAALALLRRSRK